MTVEAQSVHAVQFTLRAMIESDYPSVFNLNTAYDLETHGAATMTLEELKNDWATMARFDSGTDVCVAVSADDEIVGYVSVFEHRDPPVRPHIWGTVHPAWRNRGIGSALLNWALDRSRLAIPHCPDEARVVAQSPIRHTDEFAARMMRANGLTYALSFYRMSIDFDGPPAPAVLPDGFRLVTFAERPDHKLLAYTYGHSFADHRGWLIQWTMEHPASRVNNLLSWPTTDPNLIFILLDGDLPAGLVTVHPDSEDDADRAYVHWLAVMPGYRRQGLARQLLQHAFYSGYKIGKLGLTLNVDGSSLTGALRLYERAGMHITHQVDSYELELRPGMEYTRQ